MAPLLAGASSTGLFIPPKRRSARPQELRHTCARVEPNVDVEIQEVPVIRAKSSFSARTACPTWLRMKIFI